MTIDRRTFFKSAALTAAATPFFNFGCAPTTPQKHDLYGLSENLLDRWCAKLLKLQIKDGDSSKRGAIKCPACGDLLHGRIGDAVYPFLYEAKKTGNSRYLDGAIMLFDWIEANMSNPDGSWRNDFLNKWYGITVFTSVALAKAVLLYGDILDAKDKKRIVARLQKAGDFMHGRFTMTFSNINYPATTPCAFELLGKLLDSPKFSERARYFANSTIKYLTPNDKFLFGETHPNIRISPKGLRGIDLGYNVEESLPSLFEYAEMTGDSELREKVLESMRTHLEFMIPDGGWDNSWGTRNFKWTYWGSRTSDGCIAGYAHAAKFDARFYKAALRNAELLDACTSDGLLCGGPHFASHGVPACIHHTFAHAKCLADVLNITDKFRANPDELKLPRETQYGAKYFADIATNLVSVGKYRATITAYDTIYGKFKSGHATGGAMSLLWHEKAGPIFIASINKYITVEKQNMQAESPDDSYPVFTPRAEVEDGGVPYSNIRDLSAKMSCDSSNGNVRIETESSLVDNLQNAPISGTVACRAVYEFSKDATTLKFDVSGAKNAVKICFPIVSKTGERLEQISPNQAVLTKPDCKIKISCTAPIEIAPTKKQRAFNFVSGMEAIPFFTTANSATVKIEVV